MPLSPHHLTLHRRFIELFPVPIFGITAPSSMTLLFLGIYSSRPQYRSIQYLTIHDDGVE